MNRPVPKNICRLLVLLIVGVALGGCLGKADHSSGTDSDQSTTTPDALEFDPWYRPMDRGKVQIHTLDLAGAREALTYSLANPPDKVLKIEIRSDDTKSSRITCETAGRKLYRIVQYPLEEVPTDDIDMYGYKKTIKERLVFARAASDDTASWSAVWWNDNQMGYVEIASHDLGVDGLMKLAEEMLLDGD